MDTEGFQAACLKYPVFQRTTCGHIGTYESLIFTHKYPRGLDCIHHQWYQGSISTCSY